MQDHGFIWMGGAGQAKELESSRPSTENFYGIQASCKSGDLSHACSLKWLCRSSFSWVPWFALPGLQWFALILSTAASVEAVNINGFPGRLEATGC